MNSKALLAKGIEIIVFLFAGFGHFLLNIAPPDETGVSFPVGISSLLALCILFFISALSSKKKLRGKTKKKWLIASGVLIFLALVTSLLYSNNYSKYTFPYPSSNPVNRYMGGTQLKATAIQYMAKSRESNVSKIVEDYGGIPYREEIWEPRSIRKATFLLTFNYISLVICFASAIFCMTEGLISDETITVHKKPEPSTEKS